MTGLMLGDASPAAPSSHMRDFIADPGLYRAVLRFVQARVPKAEAADIVQATLADALGSDSAPADAQKLAPWIMGIARHKVADWFRRNRRTCGLESVDEIPALSAAERASDLLSWAERELPRGAEPPKTLEWMMREADGDKLESIADEERLPAPQVRQRVSRLRRYFRGRWLVQTGVAATVTGLVLLLYYVLRHPSAPEIVREPPPVRSAPPLDLRMVQRAQAAELRRVAFERCGKEEWQPCIDALDEARALDPEGDMTGEVAQARQAATTALTPVVPPKPSRPKPLCGPGDSC